MYKALAHVHHFFFLILLLQKKRLISHLLLSFYPALCHNSCGSIYTVYPPSFSTVCMVHYTVGFFLGGGVVMCYVHYCQTAFQLQFGLLRHLCNFITSLTWRAPWHDHEVGRKYENDYRDLRLYYSGFLIIASLICFSFLYLSFSLPPLFRPIYPWPMAHAEVEQKGKPTNEYTHIHTCSQLRLGCDYFAHHSRRTPLILSACRYSLLLIRARSRLFHCLFTSVTHSLNGEHIFMMDPLQRELHWHLTFPVLPRDVKHFCLCLE